MTSWPVICHPAIKNDSSAIYMRERGRTIWIADAHRGDGKRFVVRADAKPTAFSGLEAAIWRSPMLAGSDHACQAAPNSPLLNCYQEVLWPKKQKSITDL